MPTRMSTLHRVSVAKGYEWPLVPSRRRCNCKLPEYSKVPFDSLEGCIIVFVTGDVIKPLIMIMEAPIGPPRLQTACMCIFEIVCKIF
ncbi:hypothetical protein AVEN_256276-1 [Araneus ventricosus]|uniref:Uncharacterized protein n=1 Tax=Araneus ventricosus TaxID=182803 RepID=A0A4Y2U742_ARAVE|nr:hypothetical protein AVEN_256276-1 [Araneus ventricosus]